MTDTQGASALTPLNYEEIRRVAYLYAEGVDTGDGDLVASLFVPEGRVLGSEGSGRDSGTIAVAHSQIREWIENNFQRCQGRTLHTSQSHIIDGGDGRASMRSACVIFLTGWAPEAGIVLTARYVDRLVNTPDGWLFEERVIIQDPLPGGSREGISDPPMLTLLARADRP